MPVEKDSEQSLLDRAYSSDRDRGADAAAPEAEPEALKIAVPGEAEAPKPSAEQEDKSDASSKQYRDPETGRFVPLTELKSERGKRQEEARLRGEAERRAAAAEAALAEARRYADPQRQQPQRQFQAPDPVLEPERWAQHMEQSMRQEMNAQIFQQRLVMSEEMMRARAPDYDQVVDLFVAAAQQDPSLVQATMQHPMPAKYAYEAGRHIMALQRVGADPDAFEKRVREEERQKVLAELKAGGGSAPPPKFPGTLADASSAGDQGRMSASDESMLDRLYGSRRRR